jgi:plastocyanin
MRCSLRTVAVLAVVLGACLVVAAFGGAPAHSPARSPSKSSTATTASKYVQHLHFKYGPLKIKPGQNLIDTNKYLIPQPKEDGWIVGFKPNLKLANGTTPPVDVIHLHHGVWANALRRDATAPLFPERFFAGGEEKTALTLPPGYGYPYRTTDAWYVNYMIHDLTPRPYTVYLTYDVDFVSAKFPPPGGMKDVHPIWMDVQNGQVYPVFDALKGSGTDGTFTYPDQAVDPYPAGVHKNEYVLPESGELVETFGHLHPGGLHDDLSLVRAGHTAPLFRSSAHYFEPAGAVSWDVAMTATPNTWRVAVHAGDTLSVSTTYDTKNASWYESMGLMVVWMYNGPGGSDPFATNVNQPGHLTHGHLPENDNHGGAPTSLPDPRKLGDAPITPAIAVANFVYGSGDLNSGGKIPTVREGQSITFDNLDAGGQSVWHTITACKAPCTASTGVAYPIANASVEFDSGQLGDAGPPTAGRDTWSTPTDLDPGTYTYFCRVHPFMRGAFRVLPPTSTG